MILITRYCNILYIWNMRVSYFATVVSKKFILKALLYKSCVCRIFPFERLVNSNMRNNLSLFILVMQDTWGDPRDPAYDLCSGSRGHCPWYNSWLL
jgi:hypothetical protein